MIVENNEENADHSASLHAVNQLCCALCWRLCCCLTTVYITHTQTQQRVHC